MTLDVDSVDNVAGNEFTIIETAAGNMSGIFDDVNTPVFNDLTLSPTAPSMVAVIAAAAHYLGRVE